MKKILLFGTLICMICALPCCGNAGTRQSASQAGDQPSAQTAAPAETPTSEGIVFDHGTFQQVLDKAKAENKLVFIDAYAAWCGPCKRMAAEVFPQQKVGDYFNATFINAKFDMEQGEGVQLAQRYEVDRYPTFLILNSDGSVVGRMIGGSPADDFIERIKALVEKGATAE